jgi:hypothetical protein
MAHTLQERYSPMVDAKLRYTIPQKTGVIWNNRYEGDPKAGVVKVPVRDTESTVAAYSKVDGVAKTNGATSYTSLTINKDYAVNEIIDGYDAAAVPDNLVADRIDSAGYGMALQMNTDGTTELVSKCTPLNTASALTKDTIYAAFVAARTAMSKAKVPLQGRWALVTPDCYALVITSPEFIKASALGDSVVQNGAVGAIAGFMLYEDATIPANFYFIAGHMDWCSRVEEWAVPVKLPDISGSGTYIGASAVQGRKVYGHLVTKPETLLSKAAVLDPTLAEGTYSAGGTPLAITLGTNATSAYYRKFTTTWGAWTLYDDDSKPTGAATNKFEAYGIDGDLVRSGTVSITFTKAS